MKDKKVESNKKMSTKRQKRRITRQVRVSIEVHKKLKFLAIKEEKTISKLADQLLEDAIRYNF